MFTDEEGDKNAGVILKELENIDDECDALNVDFVKISDAGVAANYKIAQLPALIYFRRGTAIHFNGELTEEESVLSWVTITKEEDEDVIEEIDAKTLETMLDAHTNVVVYFCIPRLAI